MYLHVLYHMNYVMLHDHIIQSALHILILTFALVIMRMIIGPGMHVSKGKDVNGIKQIVNRE